MHMPKTRHAHLSELHVQGYSKEQKQERVQKI